MRIGIDLMGSDNSPLVLFEAVLEAAEHLDANSVLVVFATPETVDKLKTLLSAVPRSPFIGKIAFQIALEVIAMSDEPSTAVRRKKNSSLVQGVRFLKKKQLDAFMSTGNTGALMTTASLALPMLPGIKRPALLAVMPSQKGPVAVLDVGGNVACKALNLVQFAHMGAAYQRCAREIPVPRVGLLNIGVESKKGTSEVRQAYQILSESKSESMQFLGNVESREVFEGKVDVLVTDGFSGNVFLKTTEGVAAFIFDHLYNYNRSFPSVQMAESLDVIQRQFKYDEYPGAILCGVDGLVMKCHGHSSSRAVFNGILGLIHLVNNRLIERMKDQLKT